MIPNEIIIFQRQAEYSSQPASRGYLDSMFELHSIVFCSNDRVLDLELTTIHDKALSPRRILGVAQVLRSLGVL